MNPERPDPAGSKKPDNRLGSVEILRSLGAFGIVLFHIKAPGASIGYAALPLFIFLSVYFFLLSRKGLASSGRDLANRAQRLLVPWLFWSAVYVCLKLVDALVAQRPISSEFHAWMLFTGPAIHLWFLPFIAIVSIPLHAAFPLLARANVFWLNICGAAIAFACLAAQSSWALATPWSQWVFGLPAALFAVTMVVTRFPENPIALALWAAAAICAILFGFEKGALQLLITIAAVYIAFNLHIGLSPLVKYLSGLSLGIYLVHPAIGAALAKSGLVTLGPTIGAAILVFLLSAVATAILQRLPIVKRFV